MDPLWTELRAAIQRLAILLRRIADLERTVVDLQQQLKNARGL